MTAIERVLSSITEDRRAAYLWDTKTVSQELNVHPNRFGDWWYRAEERLIELALLQPSETAAMLALVMAKAEAERQRRRAHEQPRQRPPGRPPLR